MTRSTPWSRLLASVALIAASGAAAREAPRLWLKADAITDVANGAAVPRWPDASGFDAHATQATASNRPRFLAAAVNGKPAVEFDGTKTFLQLPNNSVIGMFADVDVFAVFAKRTDTDVDTLFAAAANPVVMVPWLGTRGRSLALGRSRPTPFEVTAAVDVPLKTFVVAEYLKEVTQVDLYLNGALVGSGKMKPPGGNIKTGIRYIGGQRNIRVFDGAVAELLVYDVALSEAERLEVRCYLAGKYALTAALSDCSAAAYSSPSEE